MLIHALKFLLILEYVSHYLSLMKWMLTPKKMAGLLALEQYPILHKRKPARQKRRYKEKIYRIKEKKQ